MPFGGWEAIWHWIVSFKHAQDRDLPQIPGGHRLHTRAHEKSRRRIRKASQRWNRLHG